MSDDKMLKLQGEFKNEKNKEINELIEQVNKLYTLPSKMLINKAVSGMNREVLRGHLETHLKVSREQLKGIDKDIIFIEFDQATKEQLDKLDAKDSIHNDPIIKKAQEKFQEIKDGSKSADSGGILGGAKKKRNIDLKADEEPPKPYTEMTIEEKMKEAQKIEKPTIHTAQEAYEILKNAGLAGWIKKPKEKQPEPKLVSELDAMANITQIIEIYDNGHENVFYPDTHILVEKADLKKIYRKLSRSIHTHTTLDNLELSVIDTLKLIKKLLGGADKE